MVDRQIADPNPNPETQEFWNAANRGDFVLRYCLECGKTHWYPRAICPHCFGEKMQWRKASGRGTVYTFSVMRRTKIPYAIAYIALDEGPKLISNIVDCNLDQIAIGQAVEIVFKKSENGFSVPMFKPLFT